MQKQQQFNKKFNKPHFHQRNKKYFYPQKNKHRFFYKKKNTHHCKTLRI